MFDWKRDGSATVMVLTINTIKGLEIYIFFNCLLIFEKYIKNFQISKFSKFSIFFYRVHGFTLDPEAGEFVLSHGNIQIPAKKAIYSLNQGNYLKWSDDVRAYVDSMCDPKDGGTPHSLRYVGRCRCSLDLSENIN